MSTERVVPSPEASIRVQMDQNPLLVAPRGSSDHEHIINLMPDIASSSSSSSDQPFPQQHEDIRDQSNSSAFIHRGYDYGDDYGRPDSSFSCLSIELIVICQIILSSLILWLGGDDMPTPLFTWVSSYACSCIATLSTLLWRRWNREWDTERIPEEGQDSSDSNPNPLESVNVNHWNTETSSILLRAHLSMLFDELMDNFKVAVDFVFACWFIIGDICFFEDSPPSQTAAIFRVLIMCLALSCIYHSMPIGMFAILSFFSSPMAYVMSLWEDDAQSRVATLEKINSLTRYKVKKMLCGDGDRGGLGASETGVLAVGKEKELTISEEDAFCSICLVEYVDSEELRELPCVHLFHAVCVDKWLKINAVCPLCRNKVWPSEEQ